MNKEWEAEWVDNTADMDMTAAQEKALEYALRGLMRQRTTTNHKEDDVKKKDYLIKARMEATQQAAYEAELIERKRQDDLAKYEPICPTVEEL